MKFKSISLFIILFFITIISNYSMAKDTTKDTARVIKKKIKYLSHTTVDFSEQLVEGKARGPEIFYIFQRKRSTGHNVIDAPKIFTEHKKKTLDILKKVVNE
jgi:hypothetical protein